MLCEFRLFRLKIFSFIPNSYWDSWSSSMTKTNRASTTNFEISSMAAVISITGVLRDPSQSRLNPFQTADSW